MSLVARICYAVNRLALLAELRSGESVCHDKTFQIAVHVYLFRPLSPKYFAWYAFPIRLLNREVFGGRGGEIE